MSFCSEWDQAAFSESENPKVLIKDLIEKQKLVSLNPIEIPVNTPMGYHLKHIEKGVFGEPSKIFEEVEEFRDALEQGNPLMALQELSDLLGAIEAYSNKYNMTLGQLIVMKDATKRAFESGKRK